MKKRIAVLICLFIISFSAVPIWGQDYESTEQTKVTAGISRALSDMYSNVQMLNNSTFYIKYLNSNSNIRIAPSIDSEIIDTLSFNTEVQVANYNDEWCAIKTDSGVYYIWKELVSDTSIDYIVYNVPYAQNKTWMSYKAITDKTSNQYRLQQIAYTGNYGIRMVNGRYCVAIGSFFNTEIGQYFDLVLENGTVIPCVMADQKADIHTDSTNIITITTDCLSEFIVDTNVLNDNAKRNGTISSCTEKWNSHVVQIKVYERIVNY